MTDRQAKMVSIGNCLAGTMAEEVLLTRRMNKKYPVLPPDGDVYACDMKWIKRLEYLQSYHLLLNIFHAECLAEVEKFWVLDAKAKMMEEDVHEAFVEQMR